MITIENEELDVKLNIYMKEDVEKFMSEKEGREVKINEITAYLWPHVCELSVDSKRYKICASSWNWFGEFYGRGRPLYRVRSFQFYGNKGDYFGFDIKKAFKKVYTL